MGQSIDEPQSGSIKLGAPKFTIWVNPITTISTKKNRDLSLQLYFQKKKKGTYKLIYWSS